MREAQARRAYVLLMFYFFIYFSDFCQTNYLNVYLTDLHEICRIGNLWPQTNDLKLFFDPSRDVAVATSYVGKIDLHSTPCSSHVIH